MPTSGIAGRRGASRLDIRLKWRILLSLESMQCLQRHSGLCKRLRDRVAVAAKVALCRKEVLYHHIARLCRIRQYRIGVVVIC